MIEPRFRDANECERRNFRSVLAVSGGDERFKAEDVQWNLPRVTADGSSETRHISVLGSEPRPTIPMTLASHSVLGYASAQNA